jgi:transposase
LESPDLKTIVDFRRDNGKALRRVCSQFIVLWRRLNFPSAVDATKFKVVNDRDPNLRRRKA